MIYDTKKGFTLIEILAVIAIIGILASVLLVALDKAMKKTHMSVAISESNQMNTSLMLYKIDNKSYPEDANRGKCPDGMEGYMDEDIWKSGPWPGSSYDWDHWDNPIYSPHEEIHQVSIRFCDISGGNCNFPNEDWAVNFDSRSAVFWCIEGPCRSHNKEELDHPGYCLNCNDPLPPYGF
ncbi:MAG: type II secretion system protein [Patescibacteria group bacterium]